MEAKMQFARLDSERIYMFENEKVKLDVLKKRAFNLRWAEVDDGIIPILHFIFREPTVGESRYEQKGKPHSGAEVLKAE